MERELEKRSGVFKVERQVFTHQAEFDSKFNKVDVSPKPVIEGFREQLKASSSRCNSCSTELLFGYLKGIFPILVWLPKYSWRTQFVKDFISGCTVAIMHIPQGMGYALLGSVDPIIGIYMAFFPVLIYVLFGTSHHISIGTFAVTTLMTGKIVDQYATQPNVSHSSNETTSSLSHLDVATAVCLMVGLWQILMYICHLGIFGIILSDHLVSGFTTGAAIHVVVSQMKSLLGIDVPHFNGPFKLARSIFAIFTLLPKANPAAVIISSISIFILAVHNDWLKPWYSKKIKFIAPTELLILVTGTVASYFGKLSSIYNVKILSHIPTGLPAPRSPPYHLLPNIMMDSFVVAVVAYAVSLSMAKIFARRRGYEIKNNQELLAQGAANVFGSFFSCMPVAASLSRSMLQETVGGETQLASVVSCLLILNILLWIGPFFESLPLAILASVIVVALKGMFVQVKDFTSVLKISPLDAVVWMITFLSVVVIDIDIGLVLGTMASVSVLIYRGHRPYAAVLGHLPGTELCVDLSLFPNAVEFQNTKIFRWVGAIHFANADTFRQVLDSHIIPPSSPSLSESNGNRKDASSPEESRTSRTYGSIDSITSAQLHRHHTSSEQIISNESPLPLNYLIIDCSGLSFVDLSGTKTLSTLYTDLMKTDANLYLAGCSSAVLEQLERCQYFKEFPKTQLFPSVIDAVLSIQQMDLFTVEPFDSLTSL